MIQGETRPRVQIKQKPVQILRPYMNQSLRFSNQMLYFPSMLFSTSNLIQKLKVMAEEQKEDNEQSNVEMQ